MVLAERAHAPPAAAGHAGARPAQVGTIFHELPSSVRAGEPVLLAEGRFRLEVVDVRDGTDVVTRVVTGGLLKKRGINLPRSNVQCPALSDQDRLDLADMLALPDVVDMVALSFVRSVADVEALREYLRQQGRPDVRIMSKIETQQVGALLPAGPARAPSRLTVRRTHRRWTTSTPSPRCPTRSWWREGTCGARSRTRGRCRG